MNYPNYDMSIAELANLHKELREKKNNVCHERIDLSVFGWCLKPSINSNLTFPKSEPSPHKKHRNNPNTYN